MTTNTQLAAKRVLESNEDIASSNALFAMDRNAKDFRTAREQISAYRRNAVHMVMQQGVTAESAEKIVRKLWAKACSRYKTRFAGKVRHG